MKAAQGAIFAVLIGLCAATPALAGSPSYFSLWTVEPATITSEVLTLKTGDFVQKTRLLPFGLVEAESDIVFTANGRLLASKGEQFFELAGGNVFRPKTGGPRVFCQMKATTETSKGLIGSSKYLLRMCLFDNQDDGQFDGAFSAINCPYEFPILNVKIPKEKLISAVQGASYRKLPPAEVRGAPEVGIVYDGIALLDGDPRFYRSFGSHLPIPLLGEKHTRAGDQPGQRVSFGGAAFTILGKDGKTISLRNDRPIPAQPFAMFGGGGC